jgi:hypothetical protein
MHAQRCQSDQLATSCTAYGCYAQQLNDQKQQPPRFSPQMFREHIHAYITQAAGMSVVEAARFFPLYDEMHQKQREINDKIGALVRNCENRLNSDAQYARLISQIDQLKLQSQKIESLYHKKMLKAVSAKTVFKAMKAEKGFHRQMLKNMAEGKDGRPQWQQPRQ